MTEQKIESVEDEEDDVVIIGDVMPKPMTSHEKKTPKRHVEFKKSQYKKQSLIITQKVKVKKRKYKCVVRKGKMNDTRSTQESVKKNNKSFTNASSEVKDKCERYAPVCLRKSCKNSRCHFESKSRRSTESVKTNRRHHFDFPRDLKRLLSPVSPSPLERDLSFDLDISFDTSSLQEDKESKLDTLIKRTRDRDRKNQMTRTQYLFTPPHTGIPNEDITEDMKMTDTNDYKPPYTSTPKYEENYDKNSSIASNNNNIIEQSKTNKSPSLIDVQIMLSPIKKADDVPIPQSIDCKEQVIKCFTSIFKDTNNQDTKSESVNSATSNTNYHQNVEDTTVHASNNIKDQVSKANKFCKDMQIQNKNFQFVQTDMSNINNEHSIFSNKLPFFTSNNTKQSIISQSLFLIDKQMQHKFCEYIETGVSNNYEQNISDQMSISNNDKDQTKKVCSPSLDNTQLLQKRSTYTQTANFNTNYEQDLVDTRMLVSNNIVEPLNKSTCSEQLQIQNYDIQTIATNTNELLIDDGNMPICNNDNVPSIENPFCQDVQNKSSEYIQTASIPRNELNIGSRNMQINNNAQATTEHTSFSGDVQAQHNKLHDMQTAISEKNVADSRMSISCSKNIVQEQVSSQKIKHTNINSNTYFEQNTEEMDMSISYDNDDNFAEQPFTHSLTYEDAHLQHKQSEYYLHTTVINTNFELNNDLNRPDDFCTNYKQIDDNNEMSITYNNTEQHLQPKTYDFSHDSYEQNNNFTQQPSSDFNPFDKNINFYAQDIKFDTYANINSADQKNYYRERLFNNKNYTEQLNSNHSPVFENFHLHNQFDYYSDNSNIQHVQNPYRKISISNDSKFNEQQNRPFYEDSNKTSKKPDNNFTDYSHKTYEQIRNERKHMFYENNFKEQQNEGQGPYFENIFVQHNSNEYNYSAHSNRKHEQIRNMSFFYDNNNSSEHQNRYQSSFSKNLYEQQRKSEYVRTSYSTKHCDRNIDNRNFKKPAQQRSAFLNGKYSFQEKYNYMYTDGSKTTHEQNFDDRDMSSSYKNNNFRVNSSKRHSPFSYDSQNKKSKFMHTHHSNEYYEQKIEKRKVSITNKNSYFEDKRNNGRVEDRHKYFQHRKSAYNTVSKKKVDIFIDKRMSDEAYEDVLLGLPPGRISPDLA